MENVFNKLDFAEKINIALGFVLRNVETGEYWYYYAHENDTLFEKLDFLCTKADLISIQGELEKFDILEQCTQERQNTKWRFKLITNVTIFAALLKNNPIGCPNSVLPEPLLKNHSVNFLMSDKDEQPYKDHLCLFCALTIYLHCHSNLDAYTSQLFTEIISKSGYDPKSFLGVTIDDSPLVERIVELNIFI